MEHVSMRHAPCSLLGNTQRSAASGLCAHVMLHPRGRGPTHSAAFVCSGLKFSLNDTFKVSYSNDCTGTASGPFRMCDASCGTEASWPYKNTFESTITLNDAGAPHSVSQSSAVSVPYGKEVVGARQGSF